MHCPPPPPGVFFAQLLSPVDAAVRGGDVLLSWAEVISKVVADPRERAASLAMQQRMPLQGHAMICSATIHNSSVIELTLSTDRLQTQAPRLGARQVIPIAKICRVSNDLPSRESSPTSERWGTEIQGNPIKALRVTLEIVDDSNEAHTFRVLYATSVPQAVRWREWLHLQVPRNDRAAPVGHVIGQLLVQTPPKFDEGVDDASRGEAVSTAAVFSDTKHARRISKDTHPLDSPRAVEFTDWKSAGNPIFSGHVRRMFNRELREFGDVFGEDEALQAQQLRAISCWRSATGYGVWDVYGHEWLSRVGSSLHETVSSTRLDHFSHQQATNVVDYRFDTAPWIAMQDRYAESAVREIAIRRELVYRLASLARKEAAMVRPPAHVHSSVSLPHHAITAEHATPAEYAAFAQEKYLDAEDMMGNVIDSVAARVAKSTGIRFH